MDSSSTKRVIDTNIPITANRSRDLEGVAVDELVCVLACAEAIKRIMRTGGLVLDRGDEIFDEYRQNLSLSGHPGSGDEFMKWVHDRRWTFPDEDRVAITKNGDTYHEFPDHAGLAQFDRSDRKFVAVANAHSEKPPILQATDSKWWGWKEALADVGVKVDFVCQDYIEAKFAQKMKE